MDDDVEQVGVVSGKGREVDGQLVQRDGASYYQLLSLTAIGCYQVVSIAVGYYQLQSLTAIGCYQVASIAVGYCQLL